MREFPKTEILKKIEWLQDVFVIRREELGFEVDELIKNAFLEVIAELVELQNTCENCKWIKFCGIKNTLDTKHAVELPNFCCNRYEKKDKQ